jgi:hypothetical protein
MRALLVLCCVVSVCACRDVLTNLVSDPDAATRPAPGAFDAAITPRDAAVRGDAAPVDAGFHTPSARCGKRSCACDDGIDNDQDGLVDGLDPECTGSFDDDEATLAIGKSNKQGTCRDCFWDDNASSADDGCRYPLECLSGSAPKNNGNCSSCQASQACQDFCRARTPNGCDCFGCCEVTTAQGDHAFVELNDNCALDRLDDTKACPRCVQNTACANPCGRCELCIGKRASDLPADCNVKPTTGQAYECDDGQAVCALSSECAGASYCQLGCCLVDLL